MCKIVEYYNYYDNEWLGILFFFDLRDLGN